MKHLFNENQQDAKFRSASVFLVFLGFQSQNVLISFLSALIFDFPWYSHLDYYNTIGKCFQSYVRME